MVGKLVARFGLSAILAVSSAAAVAQVAAHAPTQAPAPLATTALSPTGRIVARVNGRPLTDRDLVRQMIVQFPYARQHGGRIPIALQADIRRQALSQLEFDELMYQAAVRREMTIPPAKLNRAMHDFKKQFDSEAQFQTYLKQEQNGSMKELREKVRRAILIDQIFEAEVTDKARMSDAELRAFYKKNLNRFRKPESVSIQTISIGFPDNPTPAQKAEARKRAEDALRQARATKDYEGFGLLAEKISEDEWRVMMGDHKSVHRGMMPAAVEKVVFTMKPGQVSDPIEAENSFCIVRLNKHEDAHVVPFEEVRAQLKKDLESDRTAQLRSAFETKLRHDGKVEEF